MVYAVDFTFIIASIFMFFSGLSDFKTRKIPNYITFPFIIVSLFYNILIGNWKMAVVGFVVSFIIGNIFFALKFMGGGDLKLMLGIASLFGLGKLYDILVIASIIGLAWVFIEILKKYLSATKFDTHNLIYQIYFFKDFLLKHMFNKKKPIKIPFGTCLALATLVFFIRNIYF